MEQGMAQGIDYYIIPIIISIVTFFILNFVSHFLVKRSDKDFKQLIQAQDTLYTIEKKVMDMSDAMHVATLYGTASPLQLNNNGKKVAQKMGMEKNIRNASSKLDSLIRSKETITSRSDCEFRCFDITADEWKSVLGEAYAPMWQIAYGKGITQGEFRRMLGIILRDIKIEELNI